MKPFQFEEVLARVGTHITLRATQEALIQSERSAALGRLSHTVAHEVRNPVTVIGGFAHRLQKQIPKDDPTQKILSVILEETEKLERIVAEVERYCRLREPVLEPVDLAELLEKVLLSLSESLGQQGINVQRSGFSETREILGDEELLEIALNNVILNAAEAMPKGGNLELTFIPQSEGLLLSVKDTGPGIPPEIVQNVFEPLFSSKTHGAGFGLALARRIIEDQLGQITLCSSPGSGTEVRIKMP
jgi:signal transduction histidine kinase